MIPFTKAAKMSNSARLISWVVVCVQVRASTTQVGFSLEFSISTVLFLVKRSCRSPCLPSRSCTLVDLALVVVFLPWGHEGNTGEVSKMNSRSFRDDSLWDCFRSIVMATSFKVVFS
uniref:Uncharacterized protein n=1 Tax=Cannabis sativa TaxID=3483 RepID=A0A803PIF2_CANSA